jgi:hypothetical protein
MKKDKIIYWIATALTGLSLLASSFMYLSKNPELIAQFQKTGFPLFFVTLLGVAKLLAAIGLVAPIWSSIKEWAYAGYAFILMGAIWTHIATATPFVAPLIFLAVLAVSYIYYHKLNQHKVSLA